MRQSSSDDPNSALYDEDLSEHVMFISDRTSVTSQDRFINLMHDVYKATDMSALINGRARMFEVRDVYNLTGSPQNRSRTPMSTFRVESNKRYRFRIISASQKCPFRLFFDKHTIRVSAFLLSFIYLFICCCFASFFIKKKKIKKNIYYLFLFIYFVGGGGSSSVVRCVGWMMALPPFFFFFFKFLIFI